MAGRKPKPTNLRIIEGNPGKRRINKNEAKFSREKMERPVFLRGRAAAEWDRIYPEFQANGLATTADLAGLAAYCKLYARWVDAEETLERHFEQGGEFTSMSQKGGLITHPLVRICQQTFEGMMKAATEFGMTPCSRARAGSAPKSDSKDDPTAGY